MKLLRPLLAQILYKIFIHNGRMKHGRMKTTRWITGVAGLTAIMLSIGCMSVPKTEGPWSDLPGGGQSFFTFFAAFSLRHGNSPEFQAYLEEARPEVVQIGWYGPMFHGYAHHPQSTGYPMGLPVSGERAALALQADINRKIHALDHGNRIIGHFQMSTVICNPDEPFGFIKWYQEEWDEDLMGPRPTDDVAELLQRDAAGNIISRGGYIDFVELCISSPHTRQLMKRMVEIAIDTGVDGLVANYNYRGGCVCHWCQAEFKDYLRRNYDANVLRLKFGIEDLPAHVFDKINAHMPGYPDVEKATELDWAAADWGARHFKQVFDEILLDHARSIKPDFMVGTWNHRAFIPHHDERAFTPVGDWHRGENYFWYSGAHNDGDFAQGIAGDAWPHLLWLREMAEGKPFMIGRYTRRIRTALAEGVATGGAGTGLYHDYMNEHRRAAMVRHHQFVHANRKLYEQALPLSEVGIILPRQSVLNRHPESYRIVRAIAQTFAEQQVLYDMLLDQRMTNQARRLEGYDVVVLPGLVALSDDQMTILRDYVADGGKALLIGSTATMDENGRARDPAGLFESDAANANGSFAFGRGRVLRIEANGDGTDAMAALKRLTEDSPLSQIDASWKVRAAAFDLPDGLTLHMVNYDRDEAAGQGDHPITVHDVAVDLKLPAETRVASVTLRSPDSESAMSLEYIVSGGRLRLTVPEIEVYGIVEVRFRRNR